MDRVTQHMAVSPQRHMVRFNPHPEDLAVRGVLWGWAQIARYLGVSITTAKRWHRVRPLPVVRYGATLAVPKTALDRWFLERGLEQTQ